MPGDDELKMKHPVPVSSTLNGPALNDRGDMIGYNTYEVMTIAEFKERYPAEAKSAFRTSEGEKKDV